MEPDEAALVVIDCPEVLWPCAMAAINTAKRAGNRIMTVLTIEDCSESCGRYNKEDKRMELNAEIDV